MVDRVKELSNVHIQYPATSHSHRLVPQSIQSLVCRASGAEAVRAVPEVLFVERLQHHDHRPLKNFVLKSGNSQRSGLGGRAGLGNVSSSHWGRKVRAGLGSVQQRLEVVLQIHRVVLGRLSVHA